MAKTLYSLSKSQKSQKISFQHVVVGLIIFVVFFVAMFFYVVPIGTSMFVVPLFKPSGDELAKTPLIKFNGLVWASMSQTKAQEITGKNQLVFEESVNKEMDKNISKGAEFLFDFTFHERTVEKDGYAKKSMEFYAKAPNLGERPIILEPIIGFSILAIDFALIFTILITIVLPKEIGFMAMLFDRQIDATAVKIRLQTGFPDEVVNLLIIPDDELAEKQYDEELKSSFRMIWERTVSDELASAVAMLRFEDVFDENTDIVKFRNEALYGRIKEFFSDFVLKEIQDTKDGLVWRKKHYQLFKGLRLYMAHHFTEKYANNVTGLAYGGAAFLIIAVGIRGLKFIPPQKPSFILLAIFLEFTMLSLLAITLIYTEEEERMDKMLKKMEDANRSQLEALRTQQHDIHMLADVLVGQAAEIVKRKVEDAIIGYITSSDNIEKQVAEKISHNILVSLRETTAQAKGLNKKI